MPTQLEHLWFWPGLKGVEVTPRCPSLMGCAAGLPRQGWLGASCLSLASCGLTSLMAHTVCPVARLPGRAQFWPPALMFRPLIDLVYTWNYSTLPRPYLQSCTISLFPQIYHHECSSVSVELLMLDLFFPFQCCPGLNSTSICLRHQSLPFLPHSYQ